MKGTKFLNSCLREGLKPFSLCSSVDWEHLCFSLASCRLLPTSDSLGGPLASPRLGFVLGEVRLMLPYPVGISCRLTEQPLGRVWGSRQARNREEVVSECPTPEHQGKFTKAQYCSFSRASSVLFHRPDVGDSVLVMVVVMIWVVYMNATHIQLKHGCILHP